MVLENSIITGPPLCVGFTFIFIVPSKTQNWHGCASAISPSTSNWFSPAKQQENEYGHGKVCTRYLFVSTGLSVENVNTYGFQICRLWLWKSLHGLVYWSPWRVYHWIWNWCIAYFHIQYILTKNHCNPP